MGDKLTVGSAVLGPTAVSSGMPPDPLGNSAAMILQAEWKRLCVDNPARIAALEAENARLQAQVMAMPIIVRSIADFPDDPTRPDKAMTGMRISYGALRKFKALAKSTGSPDGQQ